MRPKNKSEKKASEAMFFHMRTCRSLAFSGIVNIRFENAQRKQEMGRYDGLQYSVDFILFTTG
jgi:hypothetical protein